MFYVNQPNASDVLSNVGESNRTEDSVDITKLKYMSTKSW